jgi:hypothetical protein
MIFLASRRLILRSAKKLMALSSVSCQSGDSYDRIHHDNVLPVHLITFLIMSIMRLIYYRWTNKRHASLLGIHVCTTLLGRRALHKTGMA